MKGSIDCKNSDNNDVGADADADADAVSNTWGEVADKDAVSGQQTSSSPITPPRKTSSKIPSSPGLPYPDCFSKAASEETTPSASKSHGEEETNRGKKTEKK